MQTGTRGEKQFFPAGSFTESADGIIRSYWEKVSANVGESVFAVTNPGFCTTCLFYVFVLCLCFRSIFQIFKLYPLDWTLFQIHSSGSLF